MRGRVDVVDHLDGRRIFDAFNSGARRVILHQDQLNRINVFPVPDGDTGTNLAATLSHTMGTTLVTASAGDTIVSMSDAALLGARGNSGAIFAQFLGGLSEVMRESASVTLEHFVRAVRNARERAYEAISSPREGTILTAISDWSRALIEHVRESRSFRELFDRSLPAVEKSVSSSPEKLAILKKSGVVDAGAQGFYHFVRGVRDFLTTGTAPAVESPVTLDLDAAHDIPASEESLTFRYCTEIVLKLDRPDRGGIRAELEPLGDSLIVVGSGGKVRVHIHTDHPAGVMEAMRSRGRILQQKAEDMHDQFQTVHRRRHPIALVTDSTCDLPRVVLDAHQIHVVPLRILFGDSEYIDRVTITPETFARLQKGAKPYPSTSQPPAVELHHAFAWLASHYESVIAVHVSAKMSGTYGASAKEAEKITGKKITVIDSRQVSGSLGLIVLRAAEAIDAGAGHDEVVRLIESSIAKARILVSVPTLDYMVRGGRVSPLKGILAKVMNLKPIVSVDAEGRTELHGRAFSIRSNVRKILEMVKAEHAAHPLQGFAVAHAGAEAAARRIASDISKVLGMDPRYVMEISPVISLHSGPGAVCVMTMQE